MYGNCVGTTILFSGPAIESNVRRLSSDAEDLQLGIVKMHYQTMTRTMGFLTVRTK